MDAVQKTLVFLIALCTVFCMIAVLQEAWGTVTPGVWEALTSVVAQRIFFTFFIVLYLIRRLRS
jgi:hypothetical protein